MSQLVPYNTSTAAPNVGLIEGFRLAREERQANAELERLTRRSAMAEVVAHHRTMEAANQSRRDHGLRLQAMHQHGERVAFGAEIIARSYDHIVDLVAGDPGKASYLEPLMARCSQTVTNLV